MAYLQRFPQTHCPDQLIAVLSAYIHGFPVCIPSFCKKGKPHKPKHQLLRKLLWRWNLCKPYMNYPPALLHTKAYIWHFHHAFPWVPMSADRCIRIDDILDMFVSTLIWAVPLQTDEMVCDEITETVEACEEEMMDTQSKMAWSRLRTLECCDTMTLVNCPTIYSSYSLSSLLWCGRWRELHVWFTWMWSPNLHSFWFISLV